MLVNTIRMVNLRKITSKIKLFSALTAITAIISVAIISEPLIAVKAFAPLETANLKSTINCSVFYSGGESQLINCDELYVKYEEMPQYLIDAFVCIEDRRFFEHEGVDFYRIIGALAKNLKSKSYREGASTITQQLIKNTHLSADKTLKRKINEIRLARAVERKFSKSEILEMYLNKIYFGNGIYGIGNASRYYFKKNPENLSLKECASLAAIINNPSRFNPISQPENCNNRANLVLKSMYDCGKIDRKTYLTTKNEDLIVSPTHIDNTYDEIINEACRILQCPKSRILGGKYKIYTSLKKDLTDLCSAVHSQAKDLGVENQNYAVLVSDNGGKILSFAFSGDASPFNTKRQPASTIKPLLVYAPALENNSIVPITPILDEKTDFAGYSPRNYKDSYDGWTNIKECLANSRNVPAVKILSMNGINYSKRIARRFGIEFDTKDSSLALALGGMTNGVTLNQLNGAYSAFANNGIYTKNRLITRIDYDDKPIYIAPDRSERIISEETAYFINDMLSTCRKEGTAQKLKDLDFEVAAKTGTAGNKNGNTDAYCMAYTPQYSVSVWIGGKKERLPNYVTGGNQCAEIAKNILSMLDIDKNIAFKRPENIKKLEIDKIEYIKNHKIVLALGAKKSQTLTAEFSNKKLPSAYKYYPDNFPLVMNDNIFSKEHR